MRVVVAGGSGLIGRALVGSLLADGHEVTVLTRDPDRARKRLPAGCEIRAWDGGRDPEAVVDLAGVDVVVNLCGVPVGPRPWTPGRKREIVASRVRPADALVRAMAALAPADRPKAYVSAAGTDWYTDLDAQPATEATAPPPRGNPVAAPDPRHSSGPCATSGNEPRSAPSRWASASRSFGRASCSLPARR